MPAPDSAGERQQFAELQRRLPQLFTKVFRDRHTPQTIVVIPSLSLARDELRKLEGAAHYEERLLCLLMPLRFPRAPNWWIAFGPGFPIRCRPT